VPVGGERGEEAMKAEELKERLKERLGIRNDETLIRLAMWMTIFDDNDIPERLTSDYVQKKLKEAEDRARIEGVEELVRYGLEDLAEWYGLMPWWQRISRKIRRTIKKIKKKLRRKSPPQRG
jgi:hypothetical protein